MTVLWVIITSGLLGFLAYPMTEFFAHWFSLRTEKNKDDEGKWEDNEV